MAVTDVVAGFYLAILGRPADSAGLAGFVAAVNAGLSLTAVEAAIRSSPEGQIVAIYRRELGRIPETTAVQADTAFLAQGGSLGDLARIVALSPEATSDLDTIYNQVLGRDIDPSGLGAFRAALANGASLADVRSAVVLSAEGQNTLDVLFRNELGRPPGPSQPTPAMPTAPFSQTLVAGGSLYSVRSTIALSSEARGDIVQAYQGATGTAPNLVAIDAPTSELQSGISLDSVYREIGQLSSRTLPTPANTLSDVHVAARLELGLASGPTFISSLGNNDALLTPTAQTISDSITPTSLVELGTSNGHFSAVISGFNTATDYIQLQSYQAASFANLKFTSNTNVVPGLGPVFGTTINLDANNSISITGVAPGSLQASNFRFV